MLIAFLCGAILFFASLCAFLKFDNAMLKEDVAALLRRAQRAEWESADATTARVQAEQDALSANAEAVEAQQKDKRLSAHVAGLLRQSAHDVHSTFRPRRVFHIHRATPIQIATARRPEVN